MSMKFEQPYAYPRNSRRAWQAQWIGPAADEDPSGPNQWFAFRATWHLKKPAETVPCYIAVDSKYWLWINGKSVVFEGGLKRGPTPSGTYFDELDIASYLQPGTNQIALLLWYFGKSGFCHMSSGQPGLVFESWSDEDVLCSGTNWRAIRHPAYGETDEPFPNKRLPESNIHFDARKDIGDWITEDYDDQDWPLCRSYDTPPCLPWGELIRRPIPLWKDSGVVDYVNQDMMPAVSDGKPIVCKLPYNAQVTPVLEIEASAGQLIDIRTDNYVGGSENNVRAEYVTREGVQAFESLGWMNGHEVHYTMPADVRIRKLAYRETGYDTDFSGTFECDDPLLNRLHEKAVRTLYITMRDTYMDCPDRERSQWWGDVVNELGEAFYALDVRSHALARKGIYELVNWQREDKSLFSPVPSQGCCRELPLQMLASVGRAGFWTYYWYTGERDVIADVYPRVRDYLELWQIQEDGLVIERPGEWTFVDWGEHKDARVLYNAWALLAFDGQRAMAELLGLPDDVALAEDKMASIRRRFNETFWTGSSYRSPDYDGQTDDRANAMAVVAGLANPNQYEAIRRVLKQEHHASPYMEKYVLESLYLMRYPNDALERIRQRYKKMVESDLTTLWEGWGIGHEGFGGGTINHAWSGGPLTVLCQYGLGIAPTKPGFAAFAVMPQMGTLRHMRTVVPSVAGDIAVECLRTDDRFRLSLHVPFGTTAQAGIPREHLGAKETVRINGAVTDQLPEGVSLDHSNSRYLVFNLLPGDWVLETGSE